MTGNINFEHQLNEIISAPKKNSLVDLNEKEKSILNYYSILNFVNKNFVEFVCSFVVEESLLMNFAFWLAKPTVFTI